jgi:hypothetical protein
MSYIEQSKKEGNEFYQAISREHNPERLIEKHISFSSMKDYDLYFIEGVLDAAKKDGNKKVEEYASKKLDELKKEMKIT